MPSGPSKAHPFEQPPGERMWAYDSFVKSGSGGMLLFPERGDVRIHPGEIGHLMEAIAGRRSGTTVGVQQGQAMSAGSPSATTRTPTMSRQRPAHFDSAMIDIAGL